MITRLNTSRIFAGIITGLMFGALAAASAACQFNPGSWFARPTPQCVESTLKIGASTFQVKTIPSSTKEPLNIPQDVSEMAFWVDGTNNNYVFGLSPTPDNIALGNALKGSETVSLQWANCNSSTYILSAPVAGVPDDAALLDQSTSEITIFLRTGMTGDGFVVKGELAGASISVIDTPPPGTNDIQAEISLLETIASQDGKTIRVTVSILNTGKNTISLTVNDVSLTPDQGRSTAPSGSEPALPEDIKPGASVSINLTFPKPSSANATLKIFSAEYVIDGY